MVARWLWLFAVVLVLAQTTVEASDKEEVGHLPLAKTPDQERPEAPGDETQLVGTNARGATQIEDLLWPFLKTYNPRQLSNYMLWVIVFVFAFRTFNPLDHAFGGHPPNWYDPLVVPLLFFDPRTLPHALRSLLQDLSQMLQHYKRATKHT